MKEKALYFLSQDDELERWKESGEKQLKAWMNTLDKLKEKLLSAQPPEKKYRSIGYISASGSWEMFSHTASAVNSAKKKDFMVNTLSSVRYQKMFGGLDTLFRLFRYING